MFTYSKTVAREFDCDVLVIGGGPSGFGAAVASARNGASTILLERNAMLGGMATTGLVGPFMTCYDDDCTEQIVKGIFDELCLRTEAKGGAIHPSKVDGMTTYSSYYIRSHCHVTPYQSEILALTMDEMVLEAGVQLLYNVQVVDVIREGNRIVGVIAAMKEGLAIFRAKTFIDCTGDADVAQFAGVPTWYGDKRSGLMQPVTLFFEMGNLDRETFVGELERKKDAGELGIPSHNCWSWFIAEARKNGDWTLQRDEIGNYEMPVANRWKMNCTRIPGIDATKTEDVTRGLVEGRKQVQEVMRFMRKYVPGCENAELVQVASALGIRETRHIVGKYELTIPDIMEQKHFDDAICTFAYAVDIHDPNGMGGVLQEVNHYYTIPFRCMVPVECANLLVSGRSICGSSEAAASYRVMPCCIALGQAAGTAAAMGVKAGCEAADVDIRQLRETLTAQGAVIKD